LLAAVLTARFVCSRCWGWPRPLPDQYQAILVLAALIRSSPGVFPAGASMDPASGSPRPPLSFCRHLFYVTNPRSRVWLGTAGSSPGGVAPTVGGLSHGSVFAGCVLWYLILNHYVARYHRLIRPTTFHRIFLARAAVLGMIPCSA
jgi:hypothetical protein